MILLIPSNLLSRWCFLFTCFMGLPLQEEESLQEILSSASLCVVYLLNKSQTGWGGIWAKGFLTQVLWRHSSQASDQRWWLFLLCFCRGTKGSSVRKLSCRVVAVTVTVYTNMNNLGDELSELSFQGSFWFVISHMTDVIHLCLVCFLREELCLSRGNGRGWSQVSKSTDIGVGKTCSSLDALSSDVRDQEWVPEPWSRRSLIC